MSLAQPSVPGAWPSTNTSTDPIRNRNPSPGLSLNLSSNNPFRNRIPSPNPYHNLPSPTSPPSSSSARPVSRNPFLDVFDDTTSTSQPALSSPVKAATLANDTTNNQEPALTGNSAELFDNLTLKDAPPAYEKRKPPSPPPNTMNPTVKRLPRPENRPPNNHPFPGGHRPSRSNEEEQKSRAGLPRSNKPPRELDIFADPESPERRRLRRNSESSILDGRSGKPLSAEEERRRRERRHKEREARHRDGKSRQERPSTSTKPKNPNQRLDIIDKLDVTSIYGTGLFHHDGPFDACNPNRNRQGHQRAPMQAFPKNSANNTMGGSGPVNKDLDYNQIHGRGAEGFMDFARSGAEAVSYESYSGRPSRPAVDRTNSNNPVVVNPTARVEPVHGDESMGLGTSTFLEGAPAARIAIQRRESGSEPSTGGGIARKPSLAQRIRGINNRRDNGPGARMVSPEPRNDYRAERRTSPRQLVDKPYTSPPQSAGGINRISNSSNPFLSDYDKAHDRKGESIKVAEEEQTERPRAPSSPRRGIYRRVTNDGMGEPEPKTMGFLSRVKSLKGGRRARPERREY
ncbi:MAG: hypothetical protein M1835_001078 [Candelina submexicana]|nr:MAG: hypothetical protein M1835_001078 [Candelina submexicana]